MCLEGEEDNFPLSEGEFHSLKDLKAYFVEHYGITGAMFGSCHTGHSVDCGGDDYFLLREDVNTNTWKAYDEHGDMVVLA